VHSTYILYTHTHTHTHYVCLSANSFLQSVARGVRKKGPKKKSAHLTICRPVETSCSQANAGMQMHGLSNSLIYRILRGIQKKGRGMADKLMQSGGCIEGPCTDAGP
jgi:hypothetical protein